MTLCTVEGCGRKHEAKGLCHGHYAYFRRTGVMPTKPIPTSEDRFWSQVAKSDGCWLWTGAKSARYGRFGTSGRVVQAHRHAYELLVGPIPEGYDLDHLCRTTLCVRPDHLEPVTHRENVLRGESLQAQNARKTHCPQGHPYDAENTYIQPSTGGRLCLTCNRASGAERQRRYRERKRAQR